MVPNCAKLHFICLGLLTDTKWSTNKNSEHTQTLWRVLVQLLQHEGGIHHPPDPRRVNVSVQTQHSGVHINTVLCSVKFDFNSNSITFVSHWTWVHTASFRNNSRQRRSAHSERITDRSASSLAARLAPNSVTRSCGERETSYAVAQRPPPSGTHSQPAASPLALSSVLAGLTDDDDEPAGLTGSDVSVQTCGRLRKDGTVWSQVSSVWRLSPALIKLQSEL